ncbi:hypothetical protein NO1_1001 [Candidatus Termititenax aidoneus]|uniref:Uncharacterized protein n=1 Tax=Termititenax aidoneus TaxID=2218524 RepID=A0A388TBG8_TERA1|nr:hypothetical protein NO1_1001 [Candidatus Termititenax aidoneus]
MVEAELENNTVPPENKPDALDQAGEGIAPPKEQFAPFTDGEISLSGMVSSVLKPQDEKEREKIEREFKKRQERLERQKSGAGFAWKTLLAWLLIILAAALIWAAVRPLKDAALKSWQKIVYARPPKNLAVLKHDQLVFEDTFRFKVRTNLLADKATLIISRGAKHENISGKIVSRDDRTLVWEFLASRLAKGSYNYKAYLKNTASAQLKEIHGVFEVK